MLLFFASIYPFLSFLQPCSSIERRRILYIQKYRRQIKNTCNLLNYRCFYMSTFTKKLSLFSMNAKED